MRHLLLIALLVGTVTAFAQVGGMFPDVPGVTLTNQNMIIPKDTKGKVTLVGIVYSQKSDEELDGWLIPVYNRYIEKSESQLFSGMEGNQDVNVYFVPMIRGINKAAYNEIDKKMTDRIDKRLHPHIMLYKGSIKEYKKILELDRKDKPYFYILDKSGKIVYATSGAYSKQKMQEIVEKVDYYCEH